MLRVTSPAGERSGHDGKDTGSIPVSPTAPRLCTPVFVAYSCLLHLRSLFAALETKAIPKGNAQFHQHNCHIFHSLLIWDD